MGQPYMCPYLVLAADLPHWWASRFLKGVEWLQWHLCYSRSVNHALMCSGGQLRVIWLLLHLLKLLGQVLAWSGGLWSTVR